MTDAEIVLKDVEKAMKPILIKGRGINFGSDNTPIKAIELQKCEMLTIESYKKHWIKIIIGKIN